MGDLRERGCLEGSARVEKRTCEHVHRVVRERLAKRRAGEAHVAEDVLRSARCLRGARAREARGTRGVRHARHERREAVVLWVDAQQGSCDFFFSFLYWVYVQMLVGGACGDYCIIV